MRMAVNVHAVEGDVLHAGRLRLACRSAGVSLGAALLLEAAVLVEAKKSASFGVPSPICAVAARLDLADEIKGGHGIQRHGALALDPLVAGDVDRGVADLGE